MGNNSRHNMRFSFINLYVQHQSHFEVLCETNVTRHATSNYKSFSSNDHKKKRLVEERLTVGEKEKQLSLCWQSHCMQACILDQVNQIPEQIANMETIWSNNSLGRKDSISILTLPRIIGIQIKAVSWET